MSTTTIDPICSHAFKGALIIRGVRAYVYVHTCTRVYMDLVLLHTFGRCEKYRREKNA